MVEVMVLRVIMSEEIVPVEEPLETEVVQEKASHNVTNRLGRDRDEGVVEESQETMVGIHVVRMRLLRMWGGVVRD